MVAVIEQYPRLNQAFETIALDWDGTAVETRTADASPLASVIEDLLKLGVSIAVITGTSFNNVDGQFSSLIRGPHKRNLYVLANRGLEVFGFAESSEPCLIHRRVPSGAEDLQLSKAANALRDSVRYCSGPRIDVVYNRFGRRKIDLIPEPEWADPPKAHIESLLRATEHRLRTAGINGGIKQLFELARKLAREFGPKSARVTCDAKFIEVGLTDKGDSVAWLMEHLALQAGVRPEQVLFAADEFGPIAGFEGSDFAMVTPEARDSVFVSVGPEPAGVPPEVIHIGGGPANLLHLLHQQIRLQRGL